MTRKSIKNRLTGATSPLSRFVLMMEWKFYHHHGDDMFASFLKVALRNLSHRRSTSFINLFGLAVAFAAGLLIFLWVEDEKNFDGYHRDVERVYRIAIDIRTRTAQRVFAPINPALTPALRKDLPEAEQVVRVRRETTCWWSGETEDSMRTTSCWPIPSCSKC